MPPNTNWYFPIAGPTEYSGGSWMPDRPNHRGRRHAAIDIYAAEGTSIVAPVSGVVKYVRSGSVGGHNMTLVGDDGITYYFAHMAQPPNAKSGQRLQMGTVFGFVGNTGSAKHTKHHLHFSMTKGGKKVNPLQYLDNGYKLPALSADASFGTEPQYQPLPYAGDVEYVDPFEVAQNALADGEDEEELQQFSAEGFLASAMGQMGNMVAGGSRLDYTTVGVQNVPRALVKSNEVVDEGGADGIVEG